MRLYIDVHCHIGTTITYDPAVGQTTGRCLARMASAGVVAAVVGPTAVGSSQIRGILDTKDQNGIIVRACQQFPDRFPIGLALIELRHGQVGADALEETLVEGGLQGIMWHPAGMTFERQLYPFLEVASLRGGLCLLHESPERTAAYARRFPNLVFIVHAGVEEEFESCKQLDNVWFEVVQRPKGSKSDWDLPQLINELGSERILFGSDLPYYDFRILQAQVEAADIDEATRDRIAFHNAVTLIQSFRPDWEPPGEAPAAPQNYTYEEIWAPKEAGSERLL
jgi:predicted TIM-barrel fold metal-dependent hydrolase